MEGSYLPGLVGMTQTGVEASTGDAAVLNTCGMLLEPGRWVWGTLIEFTWTWVYRQKCQSVSQRKKIPHVGVKFSRQRLTIDIVIPGQSRIHIIN